MPKFPEICCFLSNKINIYGFLIGDKLCRQKLFAAPFKSSNPLKYTYRLLLSPAGFLIART